MREDRRRKATIRGTESATQPKRGTEVTQVLMGAGKDWTGRMLLEGHYRRFTSALRALPDFIVIGAQKAGTTSLFHYVSQHPAVVPAFEKEVHYFDGGLIPGIDTFDRGPGWYRAHFPLRRRLNGGLKTGEASPLYLFSPPAPGRIRRLLPSVKLIALLRNPTERAISHYLHNARVPGREPLSMSDAFQQEEDRLGSAIAEGDFKSPDFIHYSYKARGRYHEQLERFLTRFPSEQLLILDSDQLFTDPGAVLPAVFSFVGVDETYVVKNLNPRNVGAERARVGEKVYHTLDRYFALHNERLYDLIGRRFDWDRDR